jgi:hypothetical protein
MFGRVKQKLTIFNLCPSEKGQSLVEMMILTPLLIFLLLGVFEVGNALRGYLVLVNVNREITRFAVRPGYIDFSKVDFSIPEPRVDDYDRVFDWIQTSLTEQLPLDFNINDGNADGFPDGNAAMIISHLVIDTGQPCEEIDECECDAFVEAYEAGQTYNSYLGLNLNSANDRKKAEFTADDIFIHPGMEGQEFQARLYGPQNTVTGPKATRLDYEAMLTELAAQNNKFNCEIMKKGGITSANNIIVTEVFYDQPQLFGFPFISNPYTDPVELYSHTTMRLIGGARSTGTTNLTGNIDTIGPICMALPMTVKRSIIEPTPGTLIPSGTRIDVFEGKGSGDWGWLTWNPHEDDENYLNAEWEYPQLSINDYTNPASPGWDDHTLNIGDYVTTFNGLDVSGDTRASMDAYVGRDDLIVPIWDDLDPEGFKSFSNPDPEPGEPNTVSAYKIWGFARVIIVSTGDIQLTPNKIIYANFLELADTCH